MIAVLCIHNIHIIIYIYIIIYTYTQIWFNNVIYIYHIFIAFTCMSIINYTTICKWGFHGCSNARPCWFDPSIKRSKGLRLPRSVDGCAWRIATPFFVSGVSIPQKWVLYNDFFFEDMEGYLSLERNHQSVSIPIGKPPVGLQAPSKTSCQLRANDFSPQKKARTVKSYIRRW